MSYYSEMITEYFQVILKYVAPGQEDIVIQNACKNLSFASNDSEENLDSMTEALNEADQQQNDKINQLQILFLFPH
jgi:ferritin-like protein